MMKPSLNIPTDNIYKFLSIAGGTLILLTTTLLFVHQKQHNELLFKVGPKYDQLKASKNELSEVDKIEFKYLAKRIDLASNDDLAIQYVLMVGLALGTVMSMTGFSKWKSKVQPKQDKLVDLQIENAEKENKIADLQAKKLEKEIELLSEQGKGQS